MAYNKRQKLNDNIEAIRIAFLVEKENRPATADEQAQLRKYSGFGGLKFIMNPVSHTYDEQGGRWLFTTREDSWVQSDRPYVRDTLRLHQLLMENSGSEPAYRSYVESLQNSVLSAFYTPDAVIHAVSQSLKTAGVQVSSFLDPSSGNGRFLDIFREDYPAMHAEAFEKDLLTGKILKALHADVQVTVDGFETIGRDKTGRYDLVSSNIPFGDMKVFDPAFQDSDIRKFASNTLHNYFFLKALDTVRDGGLVAFITSRGVMDSRSYTSVRMEMLRHANILSAVRLPDGMFSEEAGTEAGADLIILQKDMSKDFNVLKDEDVRFINSVESSDGIHVNSTFLSDDSHIDLSHILADDVAVGKNMYGNEALEYRYDGDMEVLARRLLDTVSGDLGKHLDKALYDQHAAAMQQAAAPRRQATAKERRSAGRSQAAGAVQLDLFSLWDAEEEQRVSMEPRPYSGDMKPFWRAGTVIDWEGQLGRLTQDTYGSYIFTPMDIPDAQQQLFRHYIPVRDSYNTLWYAEQADRQEHPEMREALNSHYDTFVAAHGALNGKHSMHVLLVDALYRDLMSIENSRDGQFVKSDIFVRPVSFSARQADHADTPEEALFASLNRYGQVDLEYMADITGHTQDDLVNELKGRIYYMPDGRYETSSKALSGNIYDKLAYVNDAIELAQEHADDPKIVSALQETKAALEQIIPPRITFDDIGLQFGERWMPTAAFSQFASEFFDDSITIGYSANADEFIIKRAKGSYNTKISDEYCVHGESQDYDGMELLHYALYDQTPVIYKVIGYNDKGEAVKGIDYDRIQLATDKIDSIREAFSEWVSRQPASWKQEMTDIYNRKYNCYVRASFDGSHLTLPDLDLKALKEKKGIDDIYRSQKDAVWMLIESGGGICDHEVGTGKTLIMCMAAHEMKRLGFAHKPLIIGMKANVNEIAATYQTAYPNDRILYAPTESKEFKDRVSFFNRMKNNDYDCIIMSHDQFAKIPQSLEVMQDVISEELRALDDALKTYEELSGQSATKRQREGLVKRKNNLQSELNALNLKLRQRADDVIDFKMMGIDHIFVDESQQFKNLPFTSKNKRIAGLGDTKGSDRARNLMYAIRTIQQHTGRDLGATFLSGTTISNSLTELYLLFKYHRPKALAAQDIYSFDAWAAVYARKTRDYEINVAGQIVMKERYRNFIKVPELATFYNEITDYKNAADVGLERPDMAVRLESIPPTEDHLDFSRRLLDFANGSSPSVIFRDKSSGNDDKAKMLIVTTMGKKASLSPKLVNPDYHEGDDTKIGVAARNIADYYYKYNEQKGTQFVFCDLSTPKSGEWSAYQELKDRLVGKYGIPAEEIAFMQDAGTEKKRNAVIEKMNSGTIRILMGSTTTLGTGVNAQQRAVAVHHLDLPWRPSDMEQRNGRAVRKGNVVARDFNGNKVDVIVYAVERSLDSYNFYLLQAKSDFIRQLKTGAVGKRQFDQGGEDEEMGMPYAEYVAITSGNTDLLEHAKLEKKILSMESLRKSYYKEQTYWQHQLGSERASLAGKEHYLAELREDSHVIFGAGSDYDAVRRDIADMDYDDFTLCVHPSFRNTFGALRYDAYSSRAFRRDSLTSDPAHDSFWLCGDALADFLRDVAHTRIDQATIVGYTDQLSNHGDYQYALTVVSNGHKNEKTGEYSFTNVFHVIPQDLSYSRDSHIRYTVHDGKMPLTDKAARVRFIADALMMIPSLIESQEKAIADTRKHIADLEVLVAKPWDKADELAALKTQMQALERKINQTLEAATKEQFEHIGTPEELPYTIEERGYGREKWRLEWKAADFPYVSYEDRESISSRLHGSLRVTSDGTGRGEFLHQYGAEQAIREIMRLSREHRDDAVWLVNAVGKVTEPCSLAAYQRLREMGLDRFGQPLGVARPRHLQVYALSDYMSVRDLSHIVKDRGQQGIDIAVKAFSAALDAMPDKDRYYLVPMPTSSSHSYTERICRGVSRETGMPVSNILAASPHDSLYDWKKEHAGEALPDLLFALSDRYDRHEGKTPLIIDNVIDTGHTARAALEAFDKESPVMMVLGTTGNHDKEGHDITVTLVDNGLQYVHDATPEGIGVTGLSEERIASLVAEARKGTHSARAVLADSGLDYYTGYPRYLVADIVSQWEHLYGKELDKAYLAVVEKYDSHTLFTDEQRGRLSDFQLRQLDADILAAKGSRSRYTIADHRKMVNVMIYSEALYRQATEGIPFALGRDAIPQDAAVQPAEVLPLHREQEDATLHQPFATQKDARDFLAGIGYDGKLSRLLTNKDGQSFIKYFSNGVVTPNIYIGETTPMDVYRQFHLYGNIMEVDIPEDVRQVLDKEQDEALQARQDYWEMEREKVRYELNKQGIPFFDVVDCERGCRIVFTENKNDNGNYTDWYDVADAEAIGDDMAIAHIRDLAEKYAAATAEKFDAQAAEPETKQPEQKDIDATADYFFRVLQDNYPVMGVYIANRMEEVSALMAKEVLTWKLNISHETSASFWNQVATRLERQLFVMSTVMNKLLKNSRSWLLSSPRMPLTMTGYCPARQSHRWPSCHAVTLTATRCSSRTMMTVSVPPCAMSPERPMSSTLTATACKAVTMTHSSISTTNIPMSSGTPLTPSSVAESARIMPLPSARR